MPRVIHFEIHAEQPERCAQFYQQLLGWRFARWVDGEPEYWLITTGPDNEPGINGGMMRRQGPIDGTAVIAFVCTVDVMDVDAAALKAGTLGGTVVVPKMPIPGIGWLCYIKDTEGNIVGLMQHDAAAQG